MLKKTLLLSISIFLFIGAFTQSTFIWSGEDNNEWFNSNNWANSNYPPSEFDVVIIPNACTYYPSTFSQNYITLNSLTIESEAKLTLPSDNSVGLFVDNPIIIKAIDQYSGILFSNHENINISFQQEFSGELFHDFSSPIENVLSEIFTNSVLYYFDSETNNWIAIGSTTVPLTPGQGFFCFNEDLTSYVFEGLANTGSVPAPTDYVECRGNSFVGNPYCTPIDWDMISSTNRFDIDKAIYVWDEEEANYKTWNGSLGTANNGIIRPGEAFFVKVESENASLIFTDDIKVNTYEKEMTAPEGYINITLTDGNYSDNTYIWWLPEATDNYDFELDAEKFFGYTYSPDIYTMGIDYNCGQDTLPYSINCLELPTPETKNYTFTKTLYFESGDSTNYTFNFTMDNLDDYISYFFVDSLLNIYEEINDAYTYSFTCLPDSLYDHRFFIKSDFGSGISENQELSFNIYASTDNKLYIQNTYEDNFPIQVFDLLGHEIYTGKLHSGKNEILIPLRNQYVIVQILSSYTPITQRVFIH